ncbi:histidine kinase [Hydrogenispora ethanolica]|uniref:histidine kinase n=1 Tax=Hydrogenispora ethanolica TaxID=1082276 RepID=A0A4R1SAD7_HYDET|nr:histidine kinase [Hydrogenispora ethanolica]TCL76476.1 histidine kinase [Hydrogenispora ethanolica]
MPKRVIRILMLVFAIAAHGIAFLQLQRQIATLALPPEFGGQIAFLLLLSLFLALILPLSRNANFIWLILIIRGGILLLVNLPFGGYLESETLLLAALIIEAHYYTSLKAGLSYSIVLVILSVYCRLQPVKAWGVYMPGVALRDLWIYALYAGFITAFSFVFCFQLNNQVSLEELSRRLDEATSQLAQANGQLIEYAGIVEQEAIQNERKRFAREIHDALAYTLSNLAMMTEAAKDLSTGDRTVFLDHLTQMHSLAKMGAVEVRRAIQALRPVQLNEESGLAAVCRLVQAFNKGDPDRCPAQFGECAALSGRGSRSGGLPPGSGGHDQRPAPRQSNGHIHFFFRLAGRRMHFNQGQRGRQPQSQAGLWLNRHAGTHRPAGRTADCVQRAGRRFCAFGLDTGKGGHS